MQANRATRMGAKWLTVGVAALGLTGCGIDYEYNADEFARKTTMVDRNAIFVDAIDARVASAFVDAESAQEDFTEFKDALHEHLRLAGVTSSDDQLVPAPKSAADVEAILAKAAKKGARQVVFLSWKSADMRGYAISLAGFSYLVGILPWIIVDSLPISRHGANSMFSVIVVDPETKEVLTQSTPLGTYGEKVTAWGYKPDSLMRDVTGVTVQRALEEVSVAHKAGFPNKRAVKDVGEFVMKWPENRMEGERLVGVGFSVKVPEGWTFDEANATLNAPESKAKLTVLHHATLLRADDRLEEQKELLAEPEDEIVSPKDVLANPSRKILSFKDAKVDGRPAVDVRFSVGAMREIERRVPVHGWQLSFICEGPKGTEADLEICARTFETVKLDVVTIPE